MPRFSRLLLSSLVALAALPAAAQDRFEIQVYDSEVARHLEPGLELHLNYAASGTRAASGSELPTNHLLRTTLEPHLGLFGWAEVGGYLQAALRPEGGYDFAGVKLRLKLRWPEKLWGWLGLAVNAELSAVPGAYEANRYGSELRFVADLTAGPLYLAINPILATDLGGELAGHPQLQPSARATLAVAPALALGLEYHAGLGPIDSPLPIRQQSHSVFGVAGLTTGNFDLDLGVGRGLGVAEPWVMRAILGIHPAPPAGGG